MTNETAILQACRLEASKLGLILSRNNSGAFEDKNGRWIRFGCFAPGGADLLGWRSVEITQDMIGQRLAVFSAIEVKRPGAKPTKEQTLFLDAVRKAGGIAGVAYGPDDLKIILADNVAT